MGYFCLALRFGVVELANRPYPPLGQGLENLRTNLTHSVDSPVLETGELQIVPDDPDVSEVQESFINFRKHRAMGGGVDAGASSTGERIEFGACDEGLLCLGRRGW